MRGVKNGLWMRFNNEHDLTQERPWSQTKKMPDWGPNPNPAIFKREVGSCPNLETVIFQSFTCRRDLCRVLDR